MLYSQYGVLLVTEHSTGGHADLHGHEGISRCTLGCRVRVPICGPMPSHATLSLIIQSFQMEFRRRKSSQQREYLLLLG